VLRKINKTNAKVRLPKETRQHTRPYETGIVVIFNQFTQQIFYQHIFRDNKPMFVLKIFKYLHCENK